MSRASSDNKPLTSGSVSVTTWSVDRDPLGTYMEQWGHAHNAPWAFDRFVGSGATTDDPDYRNPSQFEDWFAPNARQNTASLDCYAWPCSSDETRMRREEIHHQINTTKFALDYLVPHKSHTPEDSRIKDPHAFILLGNGTDGESCRQLDTMLARDVVEKTTPLKEDLEDILKKDLKLESLG
ncbi:uncharacterized protein KY384_007907 [Bacidia gigantensis]|uniref:uncharacterized protein n=1 Tax=Bacidia gigantensis TaxID=2732470 RepID=UPI001D03CDB2|nr:uncharacterized protein KY384_007907 [Bacidia gigantensis]KAG8527753.1 hypothetical protein KY384_007907 [Bacidia gigantensis]